MYRKGEREKKKNSRLGPCQTLVTDGFCDFYNRVTQKCEGVYSKHNFMYYFGMSQ
jgi:hypothetical protein